MIPAPAQYAPMALSKFYAAWGHHTTVAGDAVWFDGGALTMMSIPTALVPRVSEGEVRRLLQRCGKMAAVQRVPQAEGTTVPMFFLRDKEYGLSHLQRQFRQQVRGASCRMEARECSWAEWQIAALRCDRETLTRRGRGGRMARNLLSQSGRERIVQSALAVPGLRLHACFVGKEIAAYLVHLTLGEVCEGLLTHRLSSANPSPFRHAAHLLFYSFAATAMARPEVRAICVGRQSVPANEPLARFKHHAGFRAEPCHLRFRLHPLVAPLLEHRIPSALLSILRIGLAGKIPMLANLEVIERSCYGLSVPTSEHP